MERQSLLTQTKTRLKKVSLKTWIIGGAIFTIVLSYGVIFFIPKNVQFSYAGTNCLSHLAVAPDLQKVNSQEFNATFEGLVKIGNVSLLSTRLCLEPKTTLEKGSVAASIAPFGGWFARKPIAITIPEAPVARTSDVVGKAISTTEPLTIQLTSPDVIHQYTLEVADRTTDCAQDSAELSCDVAALHLAHGALYTASLYQTYKETNRKVIEGTLETLRPLVMTSASLSNDQTIIDKPTEATFTFDRPVTETDVTLSKVIESGNEPVEVTTQINDHTLTVRFPELAREARYSFMVNQAVGDNGSSLAAPIVINVKTSGGPKVASVSVGANKVARNAAIVVTLDQPIDGGVDVSKYAHIEGVNGTVRKKSDTQLIFTIQGGDCSAFSLTIDKGIKSGSNGAESKEAWNFNSRTICGYSWVVGTSVQGRAIIAYSFGSGSKTILFTGGIHGSEPSGYTTMLAWAQHLQAYGDSVPSGTRVVIVPNTNPDGIATRSRNNSRNVNVDRNFPTANWQSSIETTSGTLPTGGGASAGSEPEAAALIALTRQLRPRLAVSYHAQGRLVGANKFADSVSIGNTYASIVGYKTMFYNAEAVMGYAMTGEYEDWMGEEMNIPAILIELPSASGNYLTAQLPALKKMLSL